jgi:hypothetical protein
MASIAHAVPTASPMGCRRSQRKPDRSSRPARGVPARDDDPLVTVTAGFDTSEILGRMLNTTPRISGPTLARSHGTRYVSMGSQAKNSASRSARRPRHCGREQAHTVGSEVQPDRGEQAAAALSKPA